MKRFIMFALIATIGMTSAVAFAGTGGKTGMGKTTIQGRPSDTGG